MVANFSFLRPNVVAYYIEIAERERRDIMYAHLELKIDITIKRAQSLQISQK